MKLKELVENKVKPYRPARPPLSAIIAGILGLLVEKKNSEVILLPGIYYGLEKLAQKYPKYFQHVRFSKVGSEPHSERIEDILFRMGAFGLFSVGNPKFKYCNMPKAICQLVMNDIKELYGKEFIKALNPLATDLVNYVTEYESSRKY